MKYVINGRKPENLFHFFEQLSAIPRGSGNEKAVADFICSFAAERGLEYIRDRYDNVFVKKPSSKGYEERPAILLQGHLDMVCVKNKETVHDFEKDPIELKITDGWLGANGTTLGADDGAAVAVMLAVLDDKTLKHPPLECLFTVQEETGLVGAMNFDTRNITAETMINLDSEGEGEAVIGCVGSADIDVVFDPDYSDLYGKCYTVTLGGFAGGHSGADIEKERKNALILLARILSTAYDKYPFNIVSIDSGTVSNAIPCEAEAVIALSDGPAETELIEKTFAAVKDEFTASDERGYLRIEKTKASVTCGAKMLTFKATSNLLSFLTLCPCGVVRRNKQDLTFVEASANPASIHMLDGGKIKIAFMNRSSLEITQDYMIDQIKRLARLTGGVSKLIGRYPGWEPVYGTPLQKKYLSVYKELFPDSKDPTALPIHAGLECGIIAGNLTAVRGCGLDAIAIGPDIRDIHTPEERMNLDSFERFWKLITKLLERL